MVFRPAELINLAIDFFVANIGELRSSFAAEMAQLFELTSK